MALTAEQLFLLNSKTGSVARKVQLGTLIGSAGDSVADDAVTTAKILDGNVTLAKLAAGVTSSHVVKFAGKFTTIGGDATEVITVTGLAATDVVHVTVQTAGGTPRAIVAAVLTANTITVTLSGDPSTDHILAYSVLRAVA